MKQIIEMKLNLDINIHTKTTKLGFGNKGGN